MDYEYTTQQAFDLQVLLANKGNLTENDIIFRWAFRYRFYGICSASMLEGVNYSNLDTKDMAQRAMIDGQIGIASVLQIADRLIWN